MSGSRLGVLITVGLMALGGFAYFGAALLVEYLGLG
jgi:hypothetical protein